MNTPATLPALTALLRAFLAAEYPGSEPVRLSVAFRFNGRDERLILPLAATPAPIADAPVRTAECREDILRVLDEAGCSLKGSAIATKANRNYSGSFRETLRDLVNDGHIVRDAGKFKLADE